MKKKEPTSLPSNVKKRIDKCISEIQEAPPFHGLILLIRFIREGKTYHASLLGLLYLILLIFFLYFAFTYTMKEPVYFFIEDLVKGKQYETSILPDVFFCVQLEGRKPYLTYQDVPELLELVCKINSMDCGNSNEKTITAQGQFCTKYDFSRVTFNAHQRNFQLEFNVTYKGEYLSNDTDIFLVIGSHGNAVIDDVENQALTVKLSLANSYTLSVLYLHDQICPGQETKDDFPPFEVLDYEVKTNRYAYSANLCFLIEKQTKILRECDCFHPYIVVPVELKKFLDSKFYCFDSNGISKGIMHRKFQCMQNILNEPTKDFECPKTCHSSFYKINNLQNALHNEQKIVLRILLDKDLDEFFERYVHDRKLQDISLIGVVAYFTLGLSFYSIFFILEMIYYSIIIGVQLKEQQEKKKNIFNDKRDRKKY